MSEEFSEIGFDAVEDWLVEDFYSFFHQLNILYNRLAVLDDINEKQRIVKLKPALNGSLSRVKDEHRLTVKSIEIHSPGDFNLLGIDKILVQLRGLIRDLFYANKLDKEAKREENRHKAEMNKLKEQAGQQKILADQISMLRNLGYEDEEIDVAVKALLDPLTQMSELSNKKKISLKTPNKSL
ncbi:hypothetical protein [Alteromonas mediterranea]|uniref:hypothetical protein n=1 Tax=Alteromonas mediterranea TaxID=314275 RepID=UPI00035551B8|nr:hypothetical protein [Alteromonas mediterranea]AGP85572.1 hypothetical protein I607_08885 [Alteromonas mediterranea U4]AGP89703.1 hypothetical protein I876_09200 [Alteromonas mediterranea U7]